MHMTVGRQQSCLRQTAYYMLASIVTTTEHPPALKFEECDDAGEIVHRHVRQSGRRKVKDIRRCPKKLDLRTRESVGDRTDRFSQPVHPARDGSALFEIGPNAV